MTLAEILSLIAGALIGSSPLVLTYERGRRRGFYEGAAVRRALPDRNMPDDPGVRHRPRRVVQGATGLDDIAAAIAATGPPSMGHDDHDD